MIWVVGTGRCGMHNYTALNGGWIQSNKDWKKLVQKRYWGEDFNEPFVRSEIERRMNLPYNCVTDCAQFMFIDLIRDIDKNAKFVWLQRVKHKCVESFMNRVGEEDRIHPLGWDFSFENKRDLISWYYDEVNKIIFEKLQGADYEHKWTREMPKLSEEELNKAMVAS